MSPVCDIRTIDPSCYRECGIQKPADGLVCRFDKRATPNPLNLLLESLYESSAGHDGMADTYLRKFSNSVATWFGMRHTRLRKVFTQPPLKPDVDRPSGRKDGFSVPASYLSIALIQISSSSRGRHFVWTSQFSSSLTGTWVVPKPVQTALFPRYKNGDNWSKRCCSVDNQMVFK